MPRVVRFYETGAPEVLKIEELPIAQPGEGEVRLRVEAIGLNRAEVMFRRGQYLEVPEFPARIGYEAAGIVDAVGSGVTGIQIGDRVSTIPSFSMTEYGVYGESAVVPDYAVAGYPVNLTPTAGAAIWMQYLTAYGALVELGEIQREDTVLITAASSSVGLAAIQIARAAGANTIATTRTAEKKAFLLGAGADHVVVTNETDLAESVMKITSGAGARVLFDPVAGPFLGKLADAAAPGAMIVEYGALYPAATEYPLIPMLSKGITTRGYTLFELVKDPERLAGAKAYVYTGLQSGTLTPIIDRTFSLDQIADAHRYMESNQQQGKIVVSV